jgi:hypothetical protein
LLLVAAPVALAGDPTAGMLLYNDIPDSVISCGNASCHGPNPNDNVNGLQKAGNNPGIILNAIKMGVTQMMFLNGLLNPFQLDDIASYLAPQPILSGTAIDFGMQAAGTSGAPLIVTLHNAGGVDLVLSDVGVGGQNASDFSLGGSCVAGARLPSATRDRAGGDCTLTAVYHPGAAGASSASVVLAYAGATTFPSTQTVALSGIAQQLLAPQAAASATAIDFGGLPLNQPAPQQDVSIANSGSAPLTIAALTLSGAHPSDYRISGNCLPPSGGAVPTSVAPRAACEVSVDFTPQGTDPRSATLRVDHNAAGSPLLIALSGYGIATATCAPPQPPDESRTQACPAGQQGTVVQTRTYACAGASWVPGPYVTVATDCRPVSDGADAVVVEFHNTVLDHYFMTADAAEAAAIDAGRAGPGWTRTGAALGRAWTNPDFTRAAVCRFYGNTTPGPDGRPLGPNSHFYTADAAECAAVKSDAGWRFEGIVFNVTPATDGACAEGSAAVHRAYNGRFAENDSNHRYMLDSALVATMTAAGWSNEGVVFCVAPP